MEQYICTVSPFIIALFSVKDWFVNIFPIAVLDQSMLCNLALHRQGTAFKCVDCTEKLTLIGLRCFCVTLRTKGDHFDPLLTQKPNKLEQ